MNKDEFLRMIDQMGINEIVKFTIVYETYDSTKKPKTISFEK